MNAGPGKVALAGAGAINWPGLPDTSAAIRIHPTDSVIDKALFRDGVTTVIQWIFRQPPWVMWGGVLLARAVVVVILSRLWPHRRQIFTWFRTRSREVKFAMFAGVGALALILVGSGFSTHHFTYHFVETDKRFCSGCHIFVPSGQIWIVPDTGKYPLVPGWRAELPYLPPAQPQEGSGKAGLLDVRRPGQGDPGAGPLPSAFTHRSGATTGMKKFLNSPHDCLQEPGEIAALSKPGVVKSFTNAT